MSGRDDAPDRESRSADASARLYRQLPDEAPPPWLDRTIRAEAEKAARAATAVEPSRIPADRPGATGRPLPDRRTAPERPRPTGGSWSGWLPWAGSIAAGVVAVFVLLHDPLSIDDERVQTKAPTPSAAAAASDSTTGPREQASNAAAAAAPPLAQATIPDGDAAAARENAIRESASSVAATPTDSRRESPPAAGTPTPARPATPLAARPAPVAPAPGSRANPAPEPGRRLGQAAGSVTDPRSAPSAPTAPAKDEAASPVQRHRDALQATPAVRDGATGDAAPSAEHQDKAVEVPIEVPVDDPPGRGTGSINSNPGVSPAAPATAAGAASASVAQAGQPPARESAAPAPAPPRAKRRDDVPALPNDPPNPAACERRVEVLLRDLRQHDAWLVYRRCRQLFPEHEFPAALRRELPRGTTPEFR